MNQNGENFFLNTEAADASSCRTQPLVGGSRACGNRLGRRIGWDANQNVYADRLAAADRGLKGPLAEGLFRSCVHFRREALMKEQISYFPVFADAAPENDVFVLLV